MTDANIKWLSFSGKIKLTVDKKNGQYYFVGETKDAAAKLDLKKIGFIQRTSCLFEVMIDWGVADRLKRLSYANKKFVTESEINLVKNESSELKDKFVGHKEVEKKQRRVIHKKKLKNDGHFIIDDSLLEGVFTKEKAFIDNIEAIKTVKDLSYAKTAIEDREKKKILLYKGWTPIPELLLNSPNNEAWTNSGRSIIRQYFSDKEIESMLKTNESVLLPISLIKEIMTVIDLSGFKGGHILNPMAGVGHIIGCIPNEWLKNSDIHCMEQDNIKAEILKISFPNTYLIGHDFLQETVFSNYYNLVISAIPLTSKVVDIKGRTIKEHELLIIKSLQHVKSGGTGVFICPSNVMDNQYNEARKIMNDLAIFAGGVRLPDNALEQISGIRSAFDVLFFIKRKNTIHIKDNEDWLNSSQITTENGVLIYTNNYFINNKGNQNNLNKDSLNEPSQKYITGFIHSLNIHTNINLIAKNEASTKIVSNKVVYPRTELCTPKNTNNERLNKYNDIKNNFNNILKSQSIENWNDNKISGAISELNNSYDDFFNLYGAINSKINQDFLVNEDDNALLCSLEQNSGSYVKAGAFKAPVLQCSSFTILSAQSESEAFFSSLDKFGIINIDYITDIYNKYNDEIKIEERHTSESMTLYLIDNDFCFENPETKMLELKTKYLSGNLDRKLKKAHLGKSLTGEYQTNISALQDMINKDQVIDYDLSFGSFCIPENIIRQFIITTYKAEKVSVKYSMLTGKWVIGFNETDLQSKHRTHKISALKLINKIVNKSKLEIYDIKQSNCRLKLVANKSDTNEISEIVDRIKIEFDRFINKSENLDVIKKYVKSKIETNGLLSYVGNQIAFNDVNLSVILSDSQKDTIWKIINEGRLVINDMEKIDRLRCFIVALYKLKSMGLSKTPVLVVNDANLFETLKEAYHIFPAAKINVFKSTSDDFYTHDCHFILMSHTFLSEKLSDSSLNMIYLQNELEKIKRIVNHDQLINSRKRFLSSEILKIQNNETRYPLFNIDFMIFDDFKHKDLLFRSFNTSNISQDASLYLKIQSIFHNNGSYYGVCLGVDITHKDDAYLINQAKSFINTEKLSGLTMFDYKYKSNTDIDRCYYFNNLGDVRLDSNNIDYLERIKALKTIISSKKSLLDQYKKIKYKPSDIPLWSLNMIHYGFNSSFKGDIAKLQPVLTKLYEVQEVNEIEEVDVNDTPVKIIIKSNEDRDICIDWVILRQSLPIFFSSGSDVESFLSAKKTNESLILGVILDCEKQIKVLESHINKRFELS